MYKRYVFNAKDCPNKDWLKMRNKIILGDFADKSCEYLFNAPWEAYSKIDGTNCKIAFFPSTQEIKVEGKDEKSSNQQGCFEFLSEIGERIKPLLIEMFPKECARFTQVKNKETNLIQYYSVETTCIPSCGVVPSFEPMEGKVTTEGNYGVELAEAPIYIYGEYYGKGIQKCGKRYIAEGHGFAVFDIRQQGWWVPREIRDSICKKLGLEQVPYLGIMTLNGIEGKVRQGFTTLVQNVSDPTIIEEGVVARPTIPLFSNTQGKRIITKVKYCDYADYDHLRKEFSDEEFAAFSEWYVAYEKELIEKAND